MTGPTTTTTAIHIPIQRLQTHHRALELTLPLGLHGIVSHDDFQDFGRTMNEYINTYDAILERRNTIVACEVLVILFVYHFLIAPQFYKDKVSIFLGPVLVLISIIIIFLMWVVFFKKEAQQVIDEQNEVYRDVITTCTDMSQRVTSSLPSSSPVLNVTCILRSKASLDLIGSYKDMHCIEFTTTTALENNEDVAAPESDQVVTTKDDDHISYPHVV